MKKLCSVFSLIIGFAMMFSTSVCASDKPIVIGLLSGFTGTYAKMAKMEKDSVEMAVNEINQSGGLLGRKVVVVHDDTELNPAIGTRKMEQLILQKHADFIIGALSSSVTLAVMQLAKKYNKILMVPISQSVKITGEMKNKQTFRLCANPNITSKALAGWMTANLGKKFYLLTVDYAFGRSSSKAYNKILKDMGATVVGETFFPLGTKDFASYFGKIKAANPDVLFITAGGNDGISVITQAERYGIKKKFSICGDGSLVAVDILGGMGDAANGIITADYYSPSLDTPENNAWVAKYKKLYKAEPSKFSVSTYEAVMWMAQAVKQAGTTDTDKVIAALEGSTYNGPQGIKTMDPHSHQTSLDIYMIKIVDGQREIFGKAR